MMLMKTLFLKCILYFFIIICVINCDNMRLKHSIGNQRHEIHKYYIDSVRIDSIIVYTALFVKFPLFTPYYYYQDSLFCNYDSLKDQAIIRNQVYKCGKFRPLLDSIYDILKHNKQFVKVYNDSNSQVLQLFGERNCQLKVEISDLFEVYIGEKMIRIGAVRDLYSFCYFEGSIYHFGKREDLFDLLYKYRTNAKYDCINSN